MSRTPWPHQAEALALLRHSLASGRRRPMLQLPTGAGKTFVAALIVEGARAKGKRVTFVVPALSLINQTVARFVEHGITDIGVIQAKHPMTNWSKPIQIASVQTLHHRDLPQSDIVVIDEAHLWFKFYGTWMANPAWARTPFIGLSATPWTRGLGKHYDDLLIPTTMTKLIDAGFLSRFRVFAPSKPDLSAVRTVAGDYHEGDLAGVMNTNPLVADVVENWLRHGERRPTLCFAVDRAHAKHLEGCFTQAGVMTGYIDAHTPDHERERIASGFQRRQIEVVLNVGCLTTGVDWDVRCIILARPTKSEMLFTQIIGRGLRTADGKDHLLCFDHSDTHQRLGFVTDIQHATLDAGRGPAVAKARPEPRPKECPQCKFLRPAKVAKCPACGFLAQRQCDVEVEDGELVELGLKQALDRQMQREMQQQFFSMLLWVEQDRRYKPGWARASFKDRFGQWPSNSFHHQIIPASGEVLSWVRSKMIRFAKRRAA